MAHGESVFLNCPFDRAYQPLFRAAVFAVQDCGMVVRCALERDDGSEVRINKIRRIIEESSFGIHDISRTELDAATGLPRFNMPLELGLFLGAKQFGSPRQRAKQCIIFDRDRYRYQAYCSDLAGHDIRAHGCDEGDLIRGIRDAARTWRPERQLPSARVILDRYQRFVATVPALASRAQLDADDLTFFDLLLLVGTWLAENVPATS
ncbi:MAG TPA: hypothetical protein VEX86_03630 [Longimicrobium sp.]|nr:hypothetical protein [Longimicrobium sp.]